MPVRKADVVAALSVHEPRVLLAILEAAGVSPRGAEGSSELAARIADALWWTYSTPAGYVADRSTLEDIVEYAARKLKVEGLSDSGDAWARLRALTVHLAQTPGCRIDTADPNRGVSLDDLDLKVQQRLNPSWIPTAASATGGAASLGAGMAGKAFVKLAATPIGRLIPLIPTIGPIFSGVRRVASVAAFVGTPLSIALSVIAINESLGSDDRKLVPLLLGIGALGPTAVADAQEVRA